MSVETAQAWKVGDPCPACGDELAPFRAATAAEYAASIDRENPKVLPVRVDSAPAAFIAENGALHVCKGCGYKSRVLADAPDADAADAAAKPAKGRKPAASNAE